jgi:L-alanine-DL-glutamate epimerase-like enolase superfamily enzyme
MQRRTFIPSIASALLAGQVLGAAVPEYEAPLFGLPGQFARPVVIRSIDVLVKGKVMLLRVVSGDGVVGMVRCKEIDDFLPILLKRVIPFFVGKDARDLERLVDEVGIKNYKIVGQPFWSPVGSLEQAIWDLLGRTAKKPVHELMGGAKRKEIAVYLSGSDRVLDAEGEVDVYVRGMAETNTKAVKFKIGGRMGRNVDAMPGRTKKMMELARKRMGDEAVLFVDANGGYDAAMAIEVGRWLEGLGVKFFEEPCPWEEVSETKKVADALRMPVAGGECDSSLWKFEDMVKRKVVDIIQPDLNYCGGMIRAARVARMAAKVGMKIVPHNTQIDAAGAKILQFAAAVENVGEYMEFPHRALPNGQMPKAESWYTPNFLIRNGKLAVPMGAGMGVEFDPEYVKQMTRVEA